MSNPNMEIKVKELLELKRMKEELEAEIAGMEDEIKAVMGDEHRVALKRGPDQACRKFDDSLEPDGGVAIQLRSAGQFPHGSRRNRLLQAVAPGQQAQRQDVAVDLRVGQRE